MRLSRERTSNIIAVVVTAVWAVSMVLDMVSNGYQPPPMIHFSLLSTVGAIFGFKYSRKD